MNILVIYLLIIDKYNKTLSSSETLIFAKTKKLAIIIITNWRFFIGFEIGSFVPFQQSAVLSHIQIGRFCPTSTSPGLSCTHTAQVSINKGEQKFFPLGRK